ncbi:hypothetical protein VTN77DRAFT_4507 [Rasamsonia byssochlamydoides]|uniref:uncharacterized protein n=1 Tax=Rasamsonia byssochlamydoides TaxID=89139 RepID=UPI0037443B2A
MSRRPHKKSRNGCMECKRRHIKCDENRPTCVNCLTSERCCSYVDSSLSSNVSTPRSYTSPSMPSFEVSDLAGPIFDNFTAQPLENRLSVNMNHLELFHHALTEMDKSFGFDETRAQVPFRVTIKCCLSVPYLMHEVLALAALHLSILRPAQQEFYRHQAVQLQTQAISLFNSKRDELTADNCVPMFLFSSLLGIHVLCDTMTSPDNNFNIFLDRFSTYLHLHRGVRAVTSRSWHILRETELKPILESGEVIPPLKESTGHECDGLLTLIESTDLCQSSIDVCRQAIEQLQCAFDAYRRPALENRTAAIFAWPISVPAEFVDLLMHRRPEALVILAHYAVLLHDCREIWIFGSGGKYLIESITSYLGKYWAEWMAWPNSVLIASSQSATPTLMN